MSIIFAHTINRIFATKHNYIFLVNLLWTYFTLQYLTVAQMACRHYVICSTEHDRQSRWSLAYPAVCMCWR